MQPVAFAHAVTSLDELRGDDYPEPERHAWRKERPELDAHCTGFIARAPIAMLATSSAAGRCDVSPRGGPPGFLRVLDAHRLAFGDLTGNRRIDSLRNVLETGRAALLVVIPGVRETLRVHGRATLTRDPEVLAACAVPDRAPDLAIGLEVEGVYLHCAKAFIRSRLWDPATWPAPEDRPDATAILRDHQTPEASYAEVAARLETSYTERLW